MIGKNQKLKTTFLIVRNWIYPLILLPVLFLQVSRPAFKKKRWSGNLFSFQGYAHKLPCPKLDNGPLQFLPNITPWMHKHACAPHITPHRGPCMALVQRCDTNQGRWRAPLSCKHHLLLVLFKCLPSLFLLSLSLSQPLACFAPYLPPLLPLHPRLQPSLCLSLLLKSK